MAPPFPRLQHVDSTEGRLQRVEDGLGDVRAQLSAQDVSLETIKDGISDIRDTMKALSAAVGGVDARTAKLEAADGQRRAVAKWIGGIVATVIGAVVLAVLGVK